MPDVSPLVDLANTHSLQDTKTHEGIMDFYNHFSVYLNDVLNIFNVESVNSVKNKLANIGASKGGAAKFFGSIAGDVAESFVDLPLPMIGFTYQVEEIQLLKYKYSEYPYLNKNLLTYGVMKENTTFRLKCLKQITNLNPFVANVLVNDIVYRLLEQYIDRGGTFTVSTPWGVISPLVCDTVSGSPSESNGTAFIMNFKKINIIKQGGINILSTAMNSITRGGLA